MTSTNFPTKTNQNINSCITNWVELDTGRMYEVYTDPDDPENCFEIE